MILSSSFYTSSGDLESGLTEPSSILAPPAHIIQQPMQCLKVNGIVFRCPRLSHHVTLSLWWLFVLQFSLSPSLIELHAVSFLLVLFNCSLLLCMCCAAVLCFCLQIYSPPLFWSWVRLYGRDHALNETFIRKKNKKKNADETSR